MLYCDMCQRSYGFPATKQIHAGCELCNATGPCHEGDSSELFACDKPGCYVWHGPIRTLSVEEAVRLRPQFYLREKDCPKCQSSLENRATIIGSLARVFCSNGCGGFRTINLGEIDPSTDLKFS